MFQFESQNAVNNTIAANLKKVRKERKLSLDNVAEMTGVSKSMLRQIEKSESSPTMSTLWKIATGLHVSFTSLIDRGREEITIIKNHELMPFTADNGHYRLYPIFPVEKDRTFEILDIELDSGAVTESLPHADGTEEMITVYSGTVEITLDGDKKYEVPAGSSISFDGNRVHAYKNPYEEMVRLCMVINYK